MLSWLGIGLLALLAVAWWTDWLDPHVPQLSQWRAQAQRTTAGQYLSPTPEPSWVSTPGRDKAVCLRETQGELNEAYVLCRSGKRELVREELDGRRTVLRVEAIAEEQGMRPSRP